MSEKIVTLAHDKVRVLGGTVPIDGRISWISPGARGHAPVNCYLLTEGEHALLVDTGLPVHEELIVRQLEAALGPRAALSVVYTRLAEFDSLGNGAAIMRAFSVRTSWAHFAAGEWLQYQPKFDSAGEPGHPGVKTDFQILPTGDSIAFGGSTSTRRLEVIPAPLRLLATAWIYDTATGTLFTSDSFGHVTMRTAHGRRIVDGRRGTATLATVREHLETKFDWLLVADTARLRDELATIFETREIEAIAPIYGCVLTGRSVVTRHYELVQKALAEIESEAASRSRRGGDRSVSPRGKVEAGR